MAKPSRRAWLLGAGTAVVLVILAIGVTRNLSLDAGPHAGGPSCQELRTLEPRFVTPGSIVKVDAKKATRCEGELYPRYTDEALRQSQLEVFPRQGVETRTVSPGRFEIAAPLGRYHYDVLIASTNGQARRAATGTLVVTNDNRLDQAQGWLNDGVDKITVRWVPDDADLQVDRAATGTIKVTGTLPALPQGVDPLAEVEICATPSGAVETEAKCFQQSFSKQSGFSGFEQPMTVTPSGGPLTFFYRTSLAAGVAADELTAQNDTTSEAGSSHRSLWQWLGDLADSLKGVGAWIVAMAAAIGACYKGYTWWRNRKRPPDDGETVFSSSTSDRSSEGPARQ